MVFFCGWSRGCRVSSEFLLICRGVYSFRFSVRMFVRSYFRPVRGITSKFYGQATRVEYISPTTHQKAFIFGP